jgi:hypothetical protein
VVPRRPRLAANARRACRPIVPTVSERLRTALRTYSHRLNNVDQITGCGATVALPSNPHWRDNLVLRGASRWQVSNWLRLLHFGHRVGAPIVSKHQTKARTRHGGSWRMSRCCWSFCVNRVLPNNDKDRASEVRAAHALYLASRAVRRIAVSIHRP